MGVLFPLLAFHDFLTGAISLFTYFLLASPVVLAVMIRKNFKKHLQNSMQIFGDTTSCEVKYVLTEDSLTTVSRSKETSVTWRAFLQVWKYRDYWLLFNGRATYLILPLEGVPLAALMYLERKLNTAS